MNLSRLRKASQYEVQNWLIEELKLTYDQQKLMRDKELMRYGKYEFYQDKQKDKVSFMWRFTMLLVPLYIILVWTYNPLQFLFTGKWGVGQKFLNKFHYPWMSKLKLNL